jgi:outer membrane protein OmpA-like peptidoglycan-associated protein/tetratricopeptide (TPR) repeat protein
MLLVCSLTLQAQMDVSIARREFKTEKPGFKDAWRHIKDGDSFFSKQGVWYSDALNEYTIACTYNNSNAELNYKTGVSCLFSDKKDEASDFFIKAYQIKNDVAEDILLLTGRALQYSGKFPEAIEKFNNYLSSPEKKPRKNVELAKRYVEECNSALIITKDTLRIDIQNIGSNINSPADDYSEVITSEGRRMFFVSRRATSPKTSSIYDDTKYDENIFSADFMNKAWSPAILAGKNLITKYCEAPLYINEAGDRLYIYAGYEGEGDIKVSAFKKGEWRSPEPLNFGVNSSASETSFCISRSGNEIAFVSNRAKKGLGGKDIYIITKINKRKWSRPQNIGPSVNTSSDEESVSFSRGGDTLWFSSSGHNSIGGFDIFYSVKNATGQWSNAVNAGYPVNTPWDELFYYPSPNEDSTFFFVSDRSGGLGGLDIYKGRILPPPPPPKPVAPPKPDTVVIRDTVVVIKEIQKVVPPEPPKGKSLYLIGKVTDSESNDPVLARVEVIDLSTDQVAGTNTSSDVDGTYRIKLPAKKSYMVNFRSTGFLSDMKRITIPESYTEDFFSLNISLNKVKVGKKVVLNNILFELGKAVLTKSSFGELNRLVGILQDSPLMKIEISGHTDNTGSPVINAKLSNDRARAVVEYLVQKGINRTRLTYRGYGSDQPIAENTTAGGRAKNRRVEFKILEL